MTVTVLVGTQWGDEGKGKIVDYLAKDYDVVARYQGGNNAGHTVVVNKKKFKLHFIPSGIISGKEVILGTGMVIEPNAFLNEVSSLQQEGIDTSKIHISDRAHIITKKHLSVDAKDSHIGTTKKGIGPAYYDKYSRVGLRVLEYAKEYNMLSQYISDTSLLIDNAIKAGKNILIEGAQGTHLDIDYGSYPFVTSSNTIAGGACTGLGIGPTKIDKVIGVSKAYTTRVGNGPFPTELNDISGKYLLEKGGEFGTTTGRPRRCGWFDAMLVKYAVRVNGIDEIALTKLDVLSGLKNLKICVAYDVAGVKVDEVPADLSNCKPIYKELDGFSVDDWSEVAKYGFDSLPKEAKDYILTIEKLIGAKITLISYGPARSDTFIKS